jgi:hypothetical protein
MTALEILNTIEKYINQEKDPHAPRGTMFQDPYKNDYFNLFKEAYQNDYFDISSNPRLTGDAIRDYFIERWAEEMHGKQKLDLLNFLISMWDEWHYALKNQ